MKVASRVMSSLLLLVAGVGAAVPQGEDWLVGGGHYPAKLTVAVGASSTLSSMTLGNGLVERVFTFDPSGGALCTTEYRNLATAQTYFRGISPEANLTLSTKETPGHPCEGTALSHKLESVHTASTATTGAREEFNITRVTGRRFKLVFGQGVSGYQPFVNELQLRVGGAWLANNGTKAHSIVVKSSGGEGSAQGGLPWDAVDGNAATLWDAQKDTTGIYWLEIDLGAELSIDGIAITTQKSEVAGQGYYWRPRSLDIFGRALSGSCDSPFDIGGCLGQPPAQMEFWTPDDWQDELKADPAAFQFKNHSVSAPAALFPWSPGVRHSPQDIAWPPKGVHLQLTFTPPATAASDLAGVVVIVHYELYDGMPTFRKWISVHNHAVNAANIEVSTLVMEMLRAPNFAPERMSIITQQANNPTPFDQQVKPERSQSFPGRTRQFWHMDPDYDQCCDKEIHVTYTYYTFLVVGYVFDTTYFRTGGSNSTGPGALLGPGESFTSLSVRTVLHDANEAERQGLGVRQTMAALAPQQLENPLIYMITDISGYPNASAPMRLAVSQAAATGHELVIVGFGAAGYCGLCDKQMLDPKWVTWFKAEVTHAKTMGIGVSAYTLMQHNGWGEVTPAAEQALFSNGKRGGVACMATDFHARYRSNVLGFIRETGMTGLETDGQYEGYSCADETHDHHHNGIAGGWSYQLETTLEFNIALKALGVYQTGADAYVFSGANKWNHADTDAFGHLPFWPRLTVGRMYIYDSTMNRVPASGQIGVNDLAGSSVSCGPAGTAARRACFDFGLASGYALGTIPSFRSARLWDPADPDAAALEVTITRWVSFFKEHRELFVGGHMIHIARPDSRHVEATGYVRSSGAERGLLSLINPTNSTLNASFAFSLYYAGFKPGDKATVAKLPISTANMTDAGVAVSAGAGNDGPAKGAPHVVGADGGGVYEIVVECVMPPMSYAIFSVGASNRDVLPN